MGLDDLAPPEEAAKLIGESIDRGGGTFETTHRRKGGSLVFTEARTRLIEIEGEKSIICACRDITERKRSEEEIKKRNQELTALNSISSKIMQGSLNLDEVLQQISDGILEVFDCTTALIFLLDEKEGVVKWAALSTREKLIDRIKSIIGFPPKQIEFPARADFNEAVINALDGRMTVKHDLYELVRPLLSKRVCNALEKLSGSGTFIGMPLLAGGNLVGGIFATRRDDVDEKEKETMMTFANQAAVFIKHARLDQSVHEELAGRIQAEGEREQSFERLRRTLDGIVYALASTVEMKDAYTAGHQRRVARLACAIAEELGLSGQQIEGLRIAGLIHDIGKLSIPSDILSNPRRLTDAEFELVRIHPQVGYDILKEIEFPWPVAEIVLQHHERLDGSGYPNALKGEEILLEASIIAVADVVEAMASHRPYRDALGINKALEEIEKNKGKLYDPQVVDVCLRLFAEGFEFEDGTN
jgi:putative nucleotidyltransferase with HDIG domain